MSLEKHLHSLKELMKKNNFISSPVEKMIVELEQLSLKKECPDCSKVGKFTCPITRLLPGNPSTLEGLDGVIFGCNRFSRREDEVPRQAN